MTGCGTVETDGTESGMIIAVEEEQAEHGEGRSKPTTVVGDLRAALV